MQLPQVGRVLPGPAGKLQELAAAGALTQATPEALGLKPGSNTGGLSASQVGSQFDAAFLSSSWAAAKAHAEEDAMVAGPVHSVKAAKELAVGKVPRMLLLLSSFHPSGAGSAFSKVKDQTGIMGAAIHSSALQQQPQLGPGCVLLLQSVSVLTPNPGSCYLAVTADNIAKVWGPDPAGRSIRNAAHQPAGASTQHPQRQHTGGQQQYEQPPPASQQHQQPPSQQQQQQLAFRRGYAHQQQHPETPAASGADSRQTNSLFPPPSPDINSVLNEMSGSHNAGWVAAPAGADGQAGASLRSQQQPQWWQQQRAEQQGEFSHAVSGAALGAAASRFQQQQKHPGPGSMAPPPPRAPAGRPTQHGQQQQQRAGGLVGCQSQEEQVPGPSLFKGLSQLDRSAAGAAAAGGDAQRAGGRQTPAGVQVFGGQRGARPTAVGAAAAGWDGGSQAPIGAQRPGVWQSSSSSQGLLLSAAGGSSGPGIRGQQMARGSAGTAAAAPMAAAEEEDDDVEVDENIVAAIFGSQVPKAVVTGQPPQQQQPGLSVTGAIRSGSQHCPQAAAGPGSSQGLQDGGNHSNQAGAGHVLCGGVQGSRGAGMPAFGSMQPPPPRPQQQQNWGMQGSNQQQQQKASVQDRPPLSGGVLGRGPMGFGGTLLGKRLAAHLSLLDDLVADDLDDL